MTDILVDVLAENGIDFNSGSISAVGYDRESKTAYVEFEDGDAAYGYSPVEESTFNLFVEAHSLNQFWREHISTVNGEATSTKFENAYLTQRDDAAWEKDNAGVPEGVPEGTTFYPRGTKVRVTYPLGSEWNGVGEVVDDAPGAFGVTIVKMETGGRAGSDGGFYDESLSPVEDEDTSPQGDKKWLTTDEDESPFALTDEFLSSVTVQPAKFGVKYTMTATDSLGDVAGPQGPFEPVFEALSEGDALAQFAEAQAQMERLTGWDINSKIRSVTHYFE